MKPVRIIIAFTLVALVALACFAVPRLQRKLSPKTVADRLQEFGPTARTRLRPDFQKAGIHYPPKRLALVGIKAEKRLEVYASDAAGAFRFVRAYSVLAASGGPGPKLREGDRQVPEGIYSIESLNPNSRFHLALRVNYPNAFDRAQARADGRPNLGGDIMIHGNSVSIGCLAMGDPAAEDLFVLAADTGLTNITVVLAPVDFRKGTEIPAGAKLPTWAPSLYERVRQQLARFPAEQ